MQWVCAVRMLNFYDMSFFWFLYKCFFFLLNIWLQTDMLVFRLTPPKHNEQTLSLSACVWEH